MLMVLINMKIDFKDGIFFTVSEYSEKEMIKGSGFKWNPTKYRWETTDYKAVETLIQKLHDLYEEYQIPPERRFDIITASVREEIDRRKERIQDTLQKSMSSTSNIEVPSPTGLHYLPFQKAGIEFINQQKNVLVADEMGLGKTIQAIGYINLNPEIKTVLVICPASLKLNWKSELQKWLTRSFSVDVLNGHGLTDITITNYESVKSNFDLLRSRVWDLLILDESHYIKNYKAQRTKYITGFYGNGEQKEWIKGVKDYAKQKILLTGTPVLNRPMELFTQLKVLGNELGKNVRGFMSKYVETNNWGGVVGSKNLDDLQLKLRTSCMIRREKKDVLLELPDKIRQVITLPRDILSASDRKDMDRIIQYLSENWDIATGKLESSSIPFEEIAEIRHSQSIKKIPYVIEHLENVIENENKIVVFAHHHDVIDAIHEKFRDISVVATGNETLKERDEAVNRFQNDPNVKLFIGSIQAMGVGITLTASSTVIFAEVEWRPGDLFQAEDRLHRIGQKSTVLVQYLVINDSVDSYMINKILEKINIIEAVVDSSKVHKPYDISDFMNDFRESEEIENSKPELLREYVSAEEASPIIRVLKLLSSYDGDYAMNKNGVGFNRTDTGFGHSIANLDRLTPRQYAAAKRLLKKYHKQIPPEDYNLIYGEDVITEEELK